MGRPFREEGRERERDRDRRRDYQSSFLEHLDQMREERRQRQNDPSLGMDFLGERYHLHHFRRDYLQKSLERKREAKEREKKRIKA